MFSIIGGAVIILLVVVALALEERKTLVKGIVFFSICMFGLFSLIYFGVKENRGMPATSLENGFSYKVEASIERQEENYLLLSRDKDNKVILLRLEKELGVEKGERIIQTDKGLEVLR